MRGIVITEKFTDQTETLNRYLSDIKKEDGTPYFDAEHLKKNLGLK